jgi:hypothetical protein
LKRDKKNQYPEFKCGLFECRLYKNDALTQFEEIEIINTLLREGIESLDKYVQKEITGEVLQFKNFNFKLAIIQVLMYDKKIITPKFDARQFAIIYSERKINIDKITYKPIKEIKEYFQDLQIEKKLASKITEMDFEAGDEIYRNVAPSWDGEDDLFTIKKIDEEELKQFPNLKKAGGNLLEYNDEIIQLFKKYNIEII